MDMGVRRRWRFYDFPALTFNVELVKGRRWSVVDKRGEVKKDVRDVLVVVVVVDPRERSESRRSKTPKAGALKTPDSK